VIIRFASHKLLHILYYESNTRLKWELHNLFLSLRFLWPLSIPWFAPWGFSEVPYGKSCDVSVSTAVTIFRLNEQQEKCCTVYRSSIFSKGDVVSTLERNINIVLNDGNKYLLNFNYILNREEIQNVDFKFVSTSVLQVCLFLQNIVTVTAVRDSPSKTSCDTTPLLMSPSEWHSHLQQ